MDDGAWPVKTRRHLDLWLHGFAMPAALLTVAVVALVSGDPHLTDLVDLRPPRLSSREAYQRAAAKDDALVAEKVPA